METGKKKQAALVIGGLFALLVALCALAYGINRAPASAGRGPLLKPHELRGYHLETVSVRVRLKFLEIDRDGREPPFRVTAHVAFEDHSTGIVQLPEMTSAEFARYTSEFPTGEWYVATGPLYSTKSPHVILGGALSR